MLKLIFDTRSYLLATLLVASYFSVGYFHPDEHFQVLEFANSKLGLSSFDDLPWEYEFKSRQTLLPAIVYFVAKLLFFFNSYNPFLLIFLLRFFTGLLCFFLMLRISDTFVTDKSLTNTFFAICTLTFPTISTGIRFSAETISGLLFFWAIIMHNSQNPTILKQIFIGLLFGLSFFVRFQIIFAITGFLIYTLMKRETKIKVYVFYFLGAIIAISFGVIIDFWFYDTFVFTPYNYFYAQIINGVVNQFGIYPFWYYPVLLLKSYDYFTGILILGIIIHNLISNKTTVFNYIFISFLIGHSIIGHKEARFMFPMFFILPYWVLFSHNVIKAHISSKLLKTLNILLIVTFSIYTLNIIIKPQDKKVLMMEKLYNYLSYKKEPMTVVLTEYDFFYHEQTIKGYTSKKIYFNFYKSDLAKYIITNDLNKIDSIVSSNLKVLLVANQQLAIPESTINSTQISTTLPFYLEEINKKFKFETAYYLYYLNKRQTNLK
ncbi:MAG: hypothetical protein SNJ77_11030 [Cytophagales bacterium]